MKPVIFYVISVIILIAGNAASRGEKEEILERALLFPKISSNLKAKLRKLESRENFNILIEFNGGNRQALKDFRNDPISKREDVKRGVKLATLVDKLERHANTSQAEVIEFLTLRNVTFKQFWIDNHLYVKGAESGLIAELAMKFEEIERIKEPSPIKPPRRIPASDISKPPKEGESPWPILQMRARCNEIDCLGEGVVVAIIDWGVRSTHEELRDNWREDHGWFDPTEGSLIPRWTLNHGTFCAGCAVGKTLGVAPKAKWVACIIQDDNDVSVRGCAQWTLCPTNPDGSDRDCSYAPDIISNSWSDRRDIESRLGLYDVVSAWNEAGIFTLFAADNQGPPCTSVEMPANFDISFSVGAVDSVSAAVWFSSRGPTLNKAHINPNSTSGSCTAELQPDDLIQPPPGLSRGWGEESGTICLLTKPDLAAPGLNINSSDTESDTAYAVESGTSFATPYVAGVAALVICANRQAGKPPLDWLSLGNILKETASTDRISLDYPNDTNLPVDIDRTSHNMCDFAYGNCNSFPNNIYGWGEVDACNAVRKVKSRY